MRAEKSPWWFLYPFCGLELTDEHHDLNSPEPLLDDATIVSKKHIPKIVENVVTLRAVSRLQGSFVVGEMKELARDDDSDFNSFIPVRRWGDIRSKNVDRNRILSEADLRAYEVSALISLVVLGHWMQPRTTALAEQLHRGTRSQMIVSLETGKYQFNVRHKQSFAALSSNSALVLSRQELRDLLNQKEFRGFTRAFERSSGYHESIWRAVRQAAVRLADALHTVDCVSQLLGAVTALEIMLLGPEARYPLLEHRRQALLGATATKNYQVEVVLNARHAYVHKGLNNVDQALASRAVYLSLSCLLRFSQVASLFSNKDQLWSYPDFAYEGQSRYSIWTDAERASFSNLLKFDCDESVFPYERGRDGTVVDHLDGD